MLRKTLFCFVVLLLVSFSTLVIADPVLVNNPSQPLGARQTVSLQELWRVGVDGEIFFGEINKVLADNKGQVYVLDGEQCQVFVFGRDGEHLRTLSREGDGPAEARFPADVFLTYDSKVAIASNSPSQLVFLHHDGLPAGQTRIPALGTADGGLYNFNNAIEMTGLAGGDMLFTGSIDHKVDEQWQQLRFVSRFSRQGLEVVRYYDNPRSQEHDAALVERNNYFPFDFLHCVGPDGRVYLACDRDNYRISVFDPMGDPTLTIAREFKSRRRSKIERDLVESGYGGHAARHGSESHFQVADTAADIEAIHVTSDGLLRVQHSRSYVDQPAGIMLNYDVFGSDGNLQHQLAIKCDGDARRDRLVYLSEGRWVRIVGAIDKDFSQMGGSLNLHGAEENQLEIVYYQER